jgi:hypothetical protein
MHKLILFTVQNSIGMGNKLLIFGKKVYVNINVLGYIIDIK